MSDRDNWLAGELRRRGVSRREFLGFCTVMTSALALPPSLLGAGGEGAREDREAGARLARVPGLRRQHRVVPARQRGPTAAEIVLDTLSVDYHETIMAAAGHQAEEALAEDGRGASKGQYIAVVEGSIPTGADGAYCTIGGRSALDIAREVCGGAAATIAIGTCAAFGGLPAAAPNPTGALGVARRGARASRT